MTVKELHYALLRLMMDNPEVAEQEVVARVRHPGCSAGTRVHLGVEKVYPYKNALVIECSDPE